MPRSQDVTNPREVFVCTEGFSPATPPGQAPLAFRPGTQVLEGDPILTSHPEKFAPAADRIEQTTAAPGERRAIIPPSAVPAPTKEETEDAQG